MKKLVMPIVALFLFLPVNSSDLSKIKFEHLTVDDGLSQGIIEDIMQDRQGNMWFATRDGLNRYDGIRFTIFRNDRNDPQSLISSWVQSLAEDYAGNIWIGSDGLNRYDPVKDKMIRIQADPKNKDAFPGGRVYNITPDSDSTLWISSSLGLVHYFPKKNTFKTYIHDPGNPNSIGITGVFSTFISRNNKMYVTASCDPIFEYDRQHDSFLEINYKKAYSGNNNIKYIQEDPKGLLYITSEFSGIHIYDPATGESRLIDKAAGQLNALSIKTRVLFMNDNEVWVGTDGGGINVYEPKTGTFRYLVSDNRNAGSLSGNAVFKMYIDKDRNIWVGHFGSGISVAKMNKEKFTSYTNSPFNPASINKEVVTAVYEDSKGRIWVGQDGGGLSLFHEDSRSFEHFNARPGDASALTTDVILAILEDPDGNLLLGTYSGGMMIFNPETKRVVKAFKTSDGLANLNIWTVFRDSRERYWFSTLASGFTLYDPATGAIKNYTETTDELKSCSGSIMRITEGPGGKLWMSSENAGICVVDYDNKTTKSYRHDENNKNSLSYNDVKTIIFIGEAAWIATNGGGLNRLDLKTDSFRVFTMSNGLASNALMAMLKDKDNNLWISSTKGLMKFNTKTFSVESFDKSQGLQGSEFKYNAECQLRDGRMIFGGVNGMTIFHPDSIRNSPVIARVIFTDFRIFNQSVKPGDENSPLTNSINYTRRIRLRHSQSVFTIEFASIDFNTPSKNRFMYKLEGFDDSWIDAGNRNFVNYTNLDPGEYTFLIKGSNSDGVWNDTPRSIVIRILLPWYKTWVALIVFVGLAAYLVYLFLRERERKAKQDKKMLEVKIREARDELTLKVAELERQQEELLRRDTEEKDLRFMTEGVARMSDLIAQKRRNLDELATGLIGELVRYVDASAGALFVADDSDPDHIMLTMTGEFSLSSADKVNRTFLAGEGYVGSCYVERKSLAVDDIPGSFVLLRSGLGEISLDHLVFVPVIQDNVCVGVIEVASLGKLTGIRLGFVEKIAETLASVIAIIKANEKTNMILEENNVQAEELRAQEELMRQNIEELMATQEESQKREKELLDELAHLKQQLEAVTPSLKAGRKSDG
jgi:ligand-binding sensor domain-containing protein